MKQWIMIGLIICGFIPVIAQNEANQDNNNDDEIKTIFSKDTKVSGYGSFDMNITEINRRNTLLLGGVGALIFDKKFEVGFAGYGISSSNKFQGLSPAKELRLVGGWGGLHLGYILAPQEVFHVQFPLFLGIGGMQIIDPEYNWNPNEPFVTDVIDRTILFLIEPGVSLEINVTRFMRLSAGAKYRYTQGVEFNSNQIFDEDISGFSGHLSFNFGFFK